MENAFTYRSIRNECKGEYKEKGSKFLAYAFPVNNEEEVKTILTLLRKKYHDARHHCYAYRLGASGEIYRANDDQEPSGTAGKPILGQLLSFDLSNIILVVVRYFGGTKLGTGGLIQAYKSAAQHCLSNAEIITQNVEFDIELHFSYESYSEFMKLLRDFNGKILEQTIGENCMMVCRFPLQMKEMLFSRTKQTNTMTLKTIYHEKS